MVVYDPSTGVSFAVIKESSICDDANENNETKMKMKKNDSSRRCGFVVDVVFVGVVANEKCKKIQ